MALPLIKNPRSIIASFQLQIVSSAIVKWLEIQKIQNAENICANHIHEYGKLHHIYKESGSKNKHKRGLNYVYVLYTVVSY